MLSSLFVHTKTESGRNAIRTFLDPDWRSKTTMDKCVADCSPAQPAIVGCLRAIVDGEMPIVLRRTGCFYRSKRPAKCRIYGGDERRLVAAHCLCRPSSKRSSRDRVHAENAHESLRVTLSLVLEIIVQGNVRLIYRPRDIEDQCRQL
jgi:hypothetical protein